MSVWYSSKNWINDQNGFEISLMRGGVSFTDKFSVKRAESALNGPIFGYHNIYNQSNTTIGSKSSFGY